MKIKQLSIFIENKPGRLAMVTDTLTRSGINIHALSLADTSDFGIIRMIVNDNEKGKQILKEASFTVNITTVIALEMLHKPGGLNDILRLFKENDINIEYMYAFVHRDSVATLVLRCDDEDKAIAILGKNNIKMLTEQEITHL